MKRSRRVSRMSHGKRGESSLGAMVKKHLSSISIFEKQRERL